MGPPALEKLAPRAKHGGMAAQPDGGLASALADRGVTRRRFLAYCGTLTATLALPPRYAGRIAMALQDASRLPVVWLNGQDCAGNTEALLRGARPTVSEVILDVLSLDYHEVLMAAAGHEAERARDATIERFPERYVAVVEGSVPLADGGTHCLVGGRPFVDIVREVCDQAAFTVAVGSCAVDGGLPGAAGGPTGAVGVRGLVKGPVLNLPGCPVNPENLTAAIVNYVTFGELPATDPLGRPLFAYGDTVHQHCKSLPHYRARRFVEEWGDAGHRAGWCLYNMGCRGPSTEANCSVIGFNDGTSWPVEAGHGCVGCTAPRFWDAMSPFYVRGGPRQLGPQTSVPVPDPRPRPRVPEVPVADPTTTTSPSTTAPPTGPRDDGGAPVIPIATAAVAGGAVAITAAVIRRRRQLGKDRAVEPEAEEPS